MKVLLLIPEPISAGGFVSYTRHLYKTLKLVENKVIVTILSNPLRPTVSWDNHLEMKPIPVPKKADPKKIAEILSKMSDVIHVPYIYLLADAKRELKENGTCYEMEVLKHIPQEKLFLTIHDTVEMKNINLLRIPDIRPNYIFIRKRMMEYFEDKLKEDEKATWIPHPYVREENRGAYDKANLAISTSRVDWDKHYEIMLEAAKKIKNIEYEIHTSHVNRIYEYQALKGMGLEKYMKGGFAYGEIPHVYGKAKFLWDMTAIHNDGGGTQYTFLEAFDFGLIPLLNSKWDVPDSILKHTINCLYCENADDIIEQTDRILKYKPMREEIINTNLKLLEQHDPQRIAKKYEEAYHGL